MSFSFPDHLRFTEENIGQQMTPRRELKGVHPLHPEYPLLPGDVLNRRDNGTWGKFGPGLGIEGFVLSNDDLEPWHDWNERRKASA